MFSVVVNKDGNPQTFNCDKDDKIIIVNGEVTIDKPVLKKLIDHSFVPDLIKAGGKFTICMKSIFYEKCTLIEVKKDNIEHQFVFECQWTSDYTIEKLEEWYPPCYAKFKHDMKPNSIIGGREYYDGFIYYC